jgi:hypothetical protein
MEHGREGGRIRRIWSRRRAAKQRCAGIDSFVHDGRIASQRACDGRIEQRRIDVS